MGCLTVYIEVCCVGKHANPDVTVNPSKLASLKLLHRKQLLSAATFVAEALFWPSAAAPSADVLLFACASTFFSLAEQP